MRGRWRHTGVLILALALVAGASSVVQVAAWGGMLIARTVERGFGGAVASTFSGREPCRMCCAAARLRQVEDAGAPAKAPVTAVKLLKVECPLAAPIAPSAASPTWAAVPSPGAPPGTIPGEPAPPEPPPPQST